MITTVSIVTIGFSLVSAVLLLVVYLFFLNNINKSWLAVGSGVVLLLGLCCLQLEHLAFVRQNSSPLDTLYYRFLLFMLPPAFYFFSRSILFGSSTFKPRDLFHLLPLASVFVVMAEIAIPMAFLLGTGYSFWLLHLIYGLRAHRKRFELEFFFFSLFAVLAVFVLILGFSVSYIDHTYFYYFYANGIGLSFILVTGTLIVSPELPSELTEVVKLSYSNSTLYKSSFYGQHLNFGFNLKQIRQSPHR